MYMYICKKNLSALFDASLCGANSEFKTINQTLQYFEKITEIIESSICQYSLTEISEVSSLKLTFEVQYLFF